MVMTRWLSQVLVLLGMMMMTAAPVRAQEVQPPDQLISKLSQDLLATIKADPELAAGNMKKLSALVDAKVMPLVNFDRMTGMAVGRAWRQATDAQKQQLKAEFRTLLLRTYSGALSSVKDQTVQMRPTRGDLAADPEVIVRSQIVQPGREPIQLDYRMEKAPGNWKIYDVNVLGVWLVETYRNQFAQEIGSGGIDGLIKALVEKNKAAAK